MESQERREAGGGQLWSPQARRGVSGCWGAGGSGAGPGEQGLPLRSCIWGSSLPSAALRRKLVLNKPVLTHGTFSCLSVALHLLRAGATEYLGTLSSVENQQSPFPAKSLREGFLIRSMLVIIRAMVNIMRESQFLYTFRTYIIIVHLCFPLLQTHFKTLYCAVSSTNQVLKVVELIQVEYFGIFIKTRSPNNNH